MAPRERGCVVLGQGRKCGRGISPGSMTPKTGKMKIGLSNSTVSAELDSLGSVYSYLLHV